MDGVPPWGMLPGATKRLLDVTAGGAVIMDMQTYESISHEQRLLQDRVIVVTSSECPHEEGAVCSYQWLQEEHLDEFMTTRPDIREWFVLGGTSLYAHFLVGAVSEQTHKIHATLVDRSYECCDTYFPTEGLSMFEMSSFSDIEQVEQGGAGVRFVEYVRKTKESDERGYLDLMREIMAEGDTRDDRTGTGTKALFGRQLRFDITNGRLPMVTTRFTSFKMIASELLWFLRGCTDARKLSEQGVRIWDGNTTREFLDARGLVDLPQGDIGAGYGFQLRNFGAEYGTCDDDYTGAGVDQLQCVVDTINADPMSRRICMTAWNPAALSRMALPPCHACFVQFFVDSRGGLSCHMYQRSVDCFLGLAANIPSYALMTQIIAMKCGLKPTSLVISTGDSHIYNDHTTQVATQLARVPLPAPRVKLDESIIGKDWSEIVLGDFELIGYLHHPSLRAPMSV